MGRSVSYATGSRVITFAHLEDEECWDCEGTGEANDDGEPTAPCTRCDASGKIQPDSDSYDTLLDDFRDHLHYLFPSTVSEDKWLGDEDHVLASNRHALFGMSEYCGLVSYWIVPQEWDGYAPDTTALSLRWIDQIADKFVAAFGELSKVGTASNGESFYRQIHRA